MWNYYVLNKKFVLSEAFFDLLMRIIGHLV